MLRALYMAADFGGREGRWNLAFFIYISMTRPTKRQKCYRTVVVDTPEKKISSVEVTPKQEIRRSHLRGSSHKEGIECRKAMQSTTQRHLITQTMISRAACLLLFEVHDKTDGTKSLFTVC